MGLGQTKPSVQEDITNDSNVDKEKYEEVSREVVNVERIDCGSYIRVVTTWKITYRMKESAKRKILHEMLNQSLMLALLE